MKIFSSSTSTASVAILLAVAALLSRLVGIVRDRVFAHTFGAGDTLDAYYAAFRIPDLLYNLLIVGALSAGFIPVFTKLWLEDKERAWRLSNNILNILALGLVAISILLFFLTPPLTSYLVPGFKGEKLEITILLTRIMFLSPLLLGISSVISGVLQSLRSFLLYALAPIFYNIGIIIGATAFVPKFGVSGLAYGVVLGASLHLAVQIPALLRQGFRYRFIFDWRDPDMRKIGALMIPRTLGMATSQANFLVVTLLGSTLASGSVAVFNFAHNLETAPVGIIGISFAVAAFPLLAQLAAEKKTDEMVTHLSAAVRQIIFFIIPVTLILLLLRAQVVRVTLGTGAFDWNDTVSSADALAFFSLSLFAQCLIPLLARAFYAFADTWTPFAISVISMLVNIIASLLLRGSLGVSGLAFAFSISMVIQFVLLWVALRRRTGTLLELPLLKFLNKISIAAVCMAVAIQILKTPLAAIVDMTRFWGVFTQGSVAGLGGLGIYGAITYLLGISEMRLLFDGFKKRWLKTAPQEIQHVDDTVA